MPKVIIIILLTIFHFSLSAVNFDIILNRKAKTQIVISPMATPAVRFAAEELQTYIKKITTVKIDIVSADKMLKHIPSIFLGKNIFTNKLQKEIRSKAGINRAMGHIHKDEAFYLFNDNNNLYIIGGAPRGSLYATYELLEKLGCRWFMPGEMGEVIPKKNNLSISATKKLIQPGFAKRGGIWGDPPSPGQDKNWLRKIHLWAVRNRFNYNILEYHTNNKIFKNDPYMLDLYKPEAKYGGSYVFAGRGHDYAMLVPPKEYFLKHPEYFGLRDGKRSPKNWVCTSNNDVISIMKKKLINYIKKAPFHIDEMIIGADDNTLYCMCDKCMKIGEKSFTDRPVKLLNELAESIPQNTLLTFYAYNTNIFPPIKYKIRDNVNVQITYWYTLKNNCFMPITDLSNKGFKVIVDNYLDIAKNITMRPYWGHFFYFIPFPMVDVMRVDIPYFFKHRNKVNGWYSETHTHWGTQGLQFYLMGKLFWNPEADVNVILNDYYNKFYGKSAALYMKKFHAFLEKQARNLKVEHDNLMRGADVFLPNVAIKRCNSYIQQAKHASLKGDSPEEQKRLEFVSKAWAWSAKIVKAISNINKYAKNIAHYRGKNDRSLLTESDKIIKDFYKYLATKEGQIAFEPRIVGPTLKHTYFDEVINKLKTLNLDLKSLPVGESFYVDNLNRGGNSRFDALEINGFKSGIWGYDLKKDTEGYIVYEFKAKKGCKFKTFAISPYLFSRRKVGNRVKSFGNKYYNKIEFSKDGINYKTLFKNIHNHSSRQYFKMDKSIKNLNKFYVKISAGLPDRDTIVLAYLRIKLSVIE